MTLENAKEMYALGLENGISYPILQRMVLNCCCLHEFNNRFNRQGCRRSDKFGLATNFFDNPSAFPELKPKSLGFSWIDPEYLAQNYHILKTACPDVEQIRLPLNNIDPNLLQCFPKLKSIVFNLSEITDLSRAGIVFAYHCLWDNKFRDTLKQTLCRLSFTNLINFNLLNLTKSHLTEQELETVNWNCVNQIAEAFTEQIDRLECPSLHYQEWRNLLSKLPKLKSLTISATAIDSTLKLETLCPVLKQLKIEDSIQEPEALVIVAKQCSQIEYFEWTNPGNEIRDLQCLREFSSLKKLKLHQVKEEEIDYLLSCIPSLSSLRQLELDWIPVFKFDEDPAHWYYKNSPYHVYHHKAAPYIGPHPELLKHPDLNKDLFMKLIKLLLIAPSGLKISFGTDRNIRNTVKAWAVYCANLAQYKKIKATLGKAKN